MSDLSQRNAILAETETLIVAAIEQRIRELSVGMPAKVVSFDAEASKVSVQPVFVKVLLDEDDAEYVQEHPVLTGVPVMWPGGGGWAVTHPIAVGDLVWLTFADAALDAFQAAASGELVDPQASRSHRLTDAVCLPAQIRPDPSLIDVSGQGESMRVGRLDSDTAVVLRSDGTMEIGEGASSPVVLGDELVAKLQELQTAITQIVGNMGSPVVATQVASINFGSILSQRSKTL